MNVTSSALNRLRYQETTRSSIEFLQSRSSRSRSRNFRPTIPNGGLTLVELLIAGVVASVIFVVISQVILSQMAASRRIEAGQKYRELVNRINYLLSVEGSESSDVEYSAVGALITPPASCTTSAGATGSSPYQAHPIAAGTGALFLLKIPRSEGEYGSPLNVSNVYYYQSVNGDLVRCGPLSDPDGVLDHDLSRTVNGAGANIPVAAIVSRATSLEVVTASTSPACVIAGATEVSSDRQVVYNLSFSGVAYRPSCSIARAKTIFVCNPPASAAKFTASIAANGTMTVTASQEGFLEVGHSVKAPGVAALTRITAFGTGAGGTGTYSTTPTGQVVSSRSMASFIAGASFRANLVSGSSTMNVTQITVGALTVGQILAGSASFAPFTTITSLPSSADGLGNYGISPPPSGSANNASLTSTTSQVGDCS